MVNDFTSKQPFSAFVFVAVRNPKSPWCAWATDTVIEPAMAALRQQYGVRFDEAVFGSAFPFPVDDMTYIIYGPTNPLALTAEERDYLRMLSQLGAKVNILPVYPLTADGHDRPEYAQASLLVPVLCEDLGVNVIFADRMNRGAGVRTITWEDMRDNVIGETVRVKYTPFRSVDQVDLDTLARMRDRYYETVAQLADLHESCGLWQRATTDGSVLLGDGDNGGWLCSATKTSKTTMGVDDFSVVLDFDESVRTIRYAGPKLPSSDGPEHLAMSRLMRGDGCAPNLIVHFHHLELTRGGRYDRLTTAIPVEYGQFVSGHLLHRELRHMGSPWLVQREHGLVWTGHSVPHFVAFLEEVGLI